MPKRMGVDEIITVPHAEMRAAYGYQPNAAGPRRGKSVWIEDLPEPYCGYDHLLVRTALIRSDRYPKGGLVELTAPSHVAYLCRHLAGYDQEHQAVIAIDDHFRVAAIHETTIGTRAETGGMIIDVIKLPLLAGCIKMAMVHNHPGGSPLPSEADEATTLVMMQAAQCVGVKLIAAAVVAEAGWCLVGDGEVFPWDEDISRKLAR